MIEQNVRAIALWERAALHDVSKAERTARAITRTMGSGAVMLAHLAWFVLWIVVNQGAVAGIAPFDPFPFPALTTLVSLEAILLALVLLASQNRLSQQADKRAHLDLQIDLLAEREMTAVLQVLHDIARHLEVPLSAAPDQLRDLLDETDIHKLTAKVEALSKGPSDEKPD